MPGPSKIEVSTTRLVLPDAWVGHSTEAPLTLANTGTGDATLSGLEVTGDDFRLGSPPPRTLKAGDRHTLTVWFGPTTPGPARGLLRITGDGAAVEVVLAGEGRAPLDCDDGNLCTRDSFDPATEACRHEPAQERHPCDDGDPGTVDDTCRAGTCQGNRVDCDDDNPCTQDLPEPGGGCSHVPLPDGASCGDDPHYACLVDPVCDAGLCAGGPSGCLWSQVTAGGAHTMAVRADGTLWSWGAGDSGQRGDGLNGDQPEPRQLVWLGTGWLGVGAGNDGSAYLHGDGTLLRDEASRVVDQPRTWRSLDPTGDYAIGTDGTLWKLDRGAYGRVGTDADWAQVASGNRHVVALKTDGSLWTWGDNDYGQLGDGTTEDHPQPAQVGTDTDWRQVAAKDGDHSLAVKEDGTLWAWGRNEDGQLGVGAPAAIITRPVQVGTGGDWAMVSAGRSMSLGVRTDGTLWAWGWGQLGNGGEQRTAVPVRVRRDTDWAWAEASCASHSIALKTDGSLWAWGYNHFGQLGDGTYQHRLVPHRVGEGRWTAATAGRGETVAVREDGTLWVWGQGRAPPRARWRAAQIGSDDWMATAASGNASAGIRADGTLWQWGDLFGQRLPDGRNSADTPVRLSSDTDWVALDVGLHHGLALRRNGTLWTWGRREAAPVDLAPPDRVGHDYDWAAIAVGKGWGFHALAIKTDGTLWAWGDNTHGQLGLGDTEPRDAPARVGRDTDWVTVATGHGHTAAVKTDGTLWSWGFTRLVPEQVGTDSDWVDVAAAGVALKAEGTLWLLGGGPTPPTRVDAGSGWVQASTGESHTVALRADGTYGAWGSNADGQLGRTIAQHRPAQIGHDADWAKVAAGGAHSVAARDDGALFAWGLNECGQLGDGTTLLRRAPVPLELTGEWLQLEAATAHTLALARDGTLYGWGCNDAGQLGDGTTEHRLQPAPTAGGRPWAQVAAGGRHTVGLAANGTLWAWGAAGLETSSPTPVQVTEGSDWSQVAAGRGHSLALRADGTLWAWGANAQGQLGDGTTVDRSAPVRVGDDRDWTWVAAGVHLTLAGKRDGSLWAWGDGGFGQLGGGGTQAWPALVDIDRDWATASGSWHLVALKADGSLWAWGANFAGQLGIGDTRDRGRPAMVTGKWDWVQAVAGGSHTLAVKADGTLWSWGDDIHGQLGRGEHASEAATVSGGER